MRLTSEVTTDLSNHQGVSKDLRTGTGVVRVVTTAWERRYRAFIVRRFDRYSQGAGDWRPDSPQTIAAKGSSAILVNTRQMRLGLAIGVRAVHQDKESVTFSFTNLTMHPTARVPIAQLLTDHDLGRGVPRRRILVLPDDDTKGKLLDDASRRYSAAMRGEDVYHVQ